MQRHLQEIDFSQSKVDEQPIHQLTTLEFTEKTQNLVLVGGTGETHLTIAIGIFGIQYHNKRVRLYSTVDLANRLEQERNNGKQGRLTFSLAQVDSVIHLLSKL